MISIVVPTIVGREHHLDRCLNAYAEHSTLPFEFVIERDHPHCGAAWNAGAARAVGDYIHFSADDLEPLPHWDTAALAVCKQGLLPAPRVLNPDMSLDSCGGDGHEDLEDGARATFTRVPFLDRQMLAAVLPIINAHYFTDVWVSKKAREAGFETIVTRGYCFIHHWAKEGRLNSMEADYRHYRRKVA